MAKNSDVSLVRNTVDAFESSTNKLWILDADEICILFPYRFNFGKSLDKLLIVNKLLKQLYRKPRTGLKDPLYADMWIKLKSLSFEIEDDPFEVKLGKNYELLCDEALQWTERERLLEERISEKRKNPGNMLSDKKVEGLYYSLSEKKSKIYIERSVKLYEVDKRTRLCCWEFTDVNLMILADESMNGEEKVVPLMKQIDSESPFPTEDVKFSTLWSRFVKGTVSSSTFTLRDYEQPLFLCESFEISGHLIGAEQEACERAKRTCVIEIPHPWGEQKITRGMTPLKYFHDLKFDFEKLEMSWGVDIEPAYTMVNIAFEYINKASVDPSIGLPFWDKMRLLLHGRLLMNIKEWQLNWRATRNPYDKSEQLEIEWRNVRFEWTNACFEIFGDFDLFTRTASKYDDCRVLHLPALKYRADLVWHCRDEADANNHYNIRPCAPDKLPELPPGKVHDSYAAFRSQNLSLNVSFEVDEQRLKKDDIPEILLFASTFRWFQNFQAVVWRNVSRPIKKGSIFNRILPKKRPLSRHYRNFGLNLKFPKLHLLYWGSVTRHLGAELNLGTGSLNTIYRVGLSEFEDGLIRRPAATWTIIKLDSEIDDVTCYVTGVAERPEKETVQQSTPIQESSDSNEDTADLQTLETSKFYLGHVDRLVYKRKEFNQEETEMDGVSSNNLEDYTHNLVCHNFRGVWTLTNRKLTFGLVETYTRSQQLKKDLSADALKSVKVDNMNNSALSESSPDTSTRKDSSARRLSTSQTKLDDLFSKTMSGKVEAAGDDVDNSISASRRRSTSTDVLLDKLVSDLSDPSKLYVLTEEGKSDEAQSSGYALCNSEDIHEQRWHFEFINSQVMLKGIENSGCVLVTAGHAEVLNRLHQPTQVGRKLLNKKTWVGHLENMQYFSTVKATDEISNEEISHKDSIWLDSNTIQARRKNTGIDLTDPSSVLGPGDDVGSFVGGLLIRNTKLQRIVSRGGCEFYYVSFDDELEEGLEDVPASNTPAPSPSTRLRYNQGAGDPVNTFTLKHPVLEICINSAQYALILDIVSNVLLYTEPQKKEVSELEQRMGFYFQLSTAEDLKGTILNVQNNVRTCLTELNELRRVLYNLNEIMKEKEKMEAPNENCLKEIEELKSERVQLESLAADRKAYVNELGTELRIMISAYKDFMTDRVMLSPEKGRNGELMRVVEVFLNHVSWRLTQPDGQLKFVEATLMNLRYTNITMTDSSGVHTVEVGNFNMTNLMPNSPYKNVIAPSGERRVGKDIAIRVYCRVKSPVGGIGVKDHFEVNLCPLNVALTHRLYKLFMAYFFPGRAHEYVREAVEEYDGVSDGAAAEQQPPHGDKDDFNEEGAAQKPSRPTSLAISDISLSTRASVSSLESLSPLQSPQAQSSDKKSGRSRFYASLSETASKELDKMKERAAQTNNFVYVKIPEIPICFSYKGEKEKNLVDVHNFRLTLPTLQYQNRTWTWLDLMLVMKKDYKQVLVGQVIKEKLHWKGGENKETKESFAPDKAKILFGDKQYDGRKKKKKSLLSKFGLKHKSDKTDAVSFSGLSVGEQADYGLEEDSFEPLPRSGDEEDLPGAVR
ncbi:protein KIAA0100-like [Dendronephthya gigantea]|uniref:protein KIAA0100-like n=1 Tax=Dendronephthya gigantea TaxID=151771 RepID=UPI00106A717B|nr:protein KIAA0100-like [Dendronephthya gigantea]